MQTNQTLQDEQVWSHLDNHRSICQSGNGALVVAVEDSAFDLISGPRCAVNRNNCKKNHIISAVLRNYSSYGLEHAAKAMHGKYRSIVFLFSRCL